MGDIDFIVLFLDFIIPIGLFLLIIGSSVSKEKD